MRLQSHTPEIKPTIRKYHQIFQAHSQNTFWVTLSYPEELPRVALDIFKPLLNEALDELRVMLCSIS